MSLLHLTPTQLRYAASLKEKMESIGSELKKLLTTTSITIKVTRPKTGMSDEAKAKISAAAKARWAKVKKATLSSTPVAPKKKFKMSAASKAKIAAAAKARWAKIKAAKATT